MKTQVVVLHGGETFDSYEEYLKYLLNYEIDFESFFGKRWKSALQQELGDAYEVISPKMPNAMNAKYAEWKIYFEKLLPFIRDGVVLVGHSLGGIFLAKYLSENRFPTSIAATFLVAAPYQSHAPQYSLADFILPADLALFAKQSPRIFLYHSEDDPVVPFADVRQYHEKLPGATLRTFTNREHFKQEKFPELVGDIQALSGNE